MGFASFLPAPPANIAPRRANANRHTPTGVNDSPVGAGN
jgi:hypothetical protein